jgi:hypothetical protein
MQIEIHKSEPSSFLKDEIATATLKRYKLSGTAQILADLIQAGGETML